jgi:hypothetical protein
LDTCSDFAGMVYSAEAEKSAIRISRNLLIEKNSVDFAFLMTLLL